MCVAIRLGGLIIVYVSASYYVVLIQLSTWCIVAHLYFSFLVWSNDVKLVDIQVGDAS
jgi:hypothetical protein